MTDRLTHTNTHTHTTHTHTHTYTHTHTHIHTHTHTHELICVCLYRNIDISIISYHNKNNVLIVQIWYISLDFENIVDIYFFSSYGTTPFSKALK